MKTPDSHLILGEISGIKWESARKKMGGGAHKRASARWNTFHIVHLLFAVCEDCHLLILNEGWLHLTRILKYLYAGCQAVLCRSSPEEEEAPGGTQHLRINLNAFASSSVFTSWVDSGCGILHSNEQQEHHEWISYALCWVKETRN